MYFIIEAHPFILLYAIELLSYLGCPLALTYIWVILTLTYRSRNMNDIAFNDALSLCQQSNMI